MQSGVEISGKYHTLLEMARSDLFSIGMLLHYLKDTYKEEGVLDFLVNILYKYSDKEAMFFIPEFCNILLARPSVSIKRYLMDIAARNLNMYLLISWCIEAWGLGFTKSSRTRVELTEAFLEECENRMVNLIENVLDEDNEFQEIMLAKEARSDFKMDVRRFLSNLVNFSLYLKKSPANDRKNVGRKFLNNMNGWLYRRKLSSKKVQSKHHHHLYEGILFPFSPENGVFSNLV